jgi:hypothetical protein
MKKLIIIITISYLLLPVVLQGETTTTVRPGQPADRELVEQQIIELKAACFDIDIQLQQLSQQKQGLINKLVELLKQKQELDKKENKK